MPTPLIQLSGIRKAYGGGDSPTVEVLRGIDLSIHAGNSSPSSAPRGPASRP